jgi:hypothetical protein
MNTSGKLSELVFLQENIIFIQSSDSASYALSMLDKYHIASAPVIGKIVMSYLIQSGDDQKIWGFLDILDLVVYLVHVLQKRNADVKPSTIGGADVGTYLATCSEFNTAPISQVIGIYYV